MVKKILSILLIISCFTLSASNAAAQTINPYTVTWSYYLYNKDGAVIKEGVVSDKQSRYDWEAIALLNNQKVRFVPNHDSSGLYALKDSHLMIGLDFHFELGKGRLLTQVYYGSKVRTINHYFTTTPAGLALGLPMDEDGYVYVEVTNYSSNRMIIKNFNIEF